jgi:hypothetical protein
MKARLTFFWTAVVTVIFGGIMTWLSVDVFPFLYYSNFLGVLILIPCLTYLANRMFAPRAGLKNLRRILWLVLISTILTLLIFATTLIFSLLNNPMDRISRSEDQGSVSDRVCA